MIEIVNSSKLLYIGQQLLVEVSTVLNICRVTDLIKFVLKFSINE
jgi:hypothetical protein